MKPAAEIVKATERALEKKEQASRARGHAQELSADTEAARRFPEALAELDALIERALTNPQPHDNGVSLSFGHSLADHYLATRLARHAESHGYRTAWHDHEEYENAEPTGRSSVSVRVSWGPTYAEYHNHE